MAQSLQKPVAPLASDKNWSPTKAFQWDLARQMERLDFLLKWLPRYAEWGYQELYLHLEDAVQYPSLPGVARDDALTTKQFRKLVDAALSVGIKTVPIVNLLGHTQYLIKPPELRDLNELRADDGSPLERGQICPLHPRTLEIAEKLLRDMAPFCTAGKVHVGLDESFHIGKCPRCRAEIEKIGLGSHFAGHVNRLHAITTSLDLKMGVWGDMLYYIPEAIPQLPTGITAYEWYYYPFKRWPKVELYNFREADIATPLRAEGIGLYGCPMNGAFRWEPMPPFRERMDNILSWWKHGQRINAEGFLVTSWEPNRLAIELTTAMDAAAAGLWLEPNLGDPEELIARGFERVFGKKSGRSAARLALSADKYPYAGYHRWQINSRWDVAVPGEPLKPWKDEAKHFRKLVKQAARSKAPTSLAASLKFRTYLAERDLFVRNVAADVIAARSALSPQKKIGQALIRTEKFRADLDTARAAAKAMWRVSRDPRKHGPNTQMLAEDQQRFRTLQKWLKSAARNPEKVHTSSPVMGAWQLVFTVHNFAPALQRVAVEQQSHDGTWHTHYATFLIEFQSLAAKSKANIHRMHSVSIASNGEEPVHLRFAARGFGQLKVRSIRITNGWYTHSPVKPRLSIKLGLPVPKRGFPQVDWDKNRTTTELKLRIKKGRINPAL